MLDVNRHQGIEVAITPGFVLRNIKCQSTIKQTENNCKNARNECSLSLHVPRAHTAHPAMKIQLYYWTVTLHIQEMEDSHLRNVKSSQRTRTLSTCCPDRGHHRCFMAPMSYRSDNGGGAFVPGSAAARCRTKRC